MTCPRCGGQLRPVESTSGTAAWPATWPWACTGALCWYVAHRPLSQA